MKKLLAIFGLSLCLLFADHGIVAAGKGGGGRSSGSGGRSYSSGSSTSGRSYSSSSSGRPSSSSGTSGESYSSGSKPSGKSYSSGSGSKSGTSGAPVSPSGKSYSSGGGPSPMGKGYATGSNSSKPTGSYDSAAGRSMQRAESRQAYQRGTKSATTYTDASNKVQPIDPKDQKIDYLRRQLDHQRWVNRVERQQSFYGMGIWGRPTYGYYRDPYSDFFWTWLLMRSISIDQRAMWAYHHRYAMDDGRYQYLLNNNAELRAHVAALEAKQVARDPTFRPTDPNTGQPMDYDLMYRDSYVDAAYNPQGTPGTARSSGHFWEVALVVVLIAAVIAVMVWLIFFKRWG